MMTLNVQRMGTSRWERGRSCWEGRLGSEPQMSGYVLVPCVEGFECL